MNKEIIHKVLSKSYINQTELVNIIKYLIDYIEEIENKIQNHISFSVFSEDVESCSSTSSHIQEEIK